jgi:hypothetical protein
MPRSPKPIEDRHDLSRILDDSEIASARKALEALFGASLGPILDRAGIDPEILRFISFSNRLKRERESKGMMLKEAATQMKVPQYRLRAIESGEINNLNPGILRRYISLLKTSAWSREWAWANPELAVELEPKNSEDRST